MATTYIKIRNRRLARRIMRLERMCANFIICTAFFFALSIFLSATLLVVLHDKSTKINDLQQQLSKANEMYSTLSSESSYEYNLLQDKYTQLEDDFVTINTTLDEQNKELVDKYNELNSEYQNTVNEANERAKFYKDYEWVTTYSGTDITYDDIDTLESIAEDNNMGKDTVDLVLSIAMVESEGNENAYNKSGASGLGQLMPSTAKYAYETLMNNGSGTYRSEYAFNHTTNLKMALHTINYLSNDSDHNALTVVCKYRGKYSQGYINAVNSYLSNLGKSIDTIDV